MQYLLYFIVRHDVDPHSHILHTIKQSTKLRQIYE